jgi:hypothetical protein
MSLLLVASVMWTTIPDQCIAYQAAAIPANTTEPNRRKKSAGSAAERCRCEAEQTMAVYKRNGSTYPTLVVFASIAKVTQNNVSATSRGHAASSARSATHASPATAHRLAGLRQELLIERR